MMCKDDGTQRNHSARPCVMNPSIHSTWLPCLLWSALGLHIASLLINLWNAWHRAALACSCSVFSQCSFTKQADRRDIADLLYKRCVEEHDTKLESVVFVDHIIQTPCA
uniref:AlNc14C92G5722 protein n=1 Tax=Albugo laibachii Nc14 TaxID=890382 RepID=F0WGI8_9STRA|nr:AlNc14C92G5722 [Albugo laibachii Nc14]|eukprot:CCA20352.1 AlNc14C92G5722 [Albugo laibachii Nc14]